MNDSNRFSDLIQRHSRLIQRVADTYCRDATDREDVVQEIAVQLWRSRERYDERFKETTWIYRVALNVAISFHRREQRHRMVRAQVEPQLISMDEAAEPSEEVRLLLDCIHELDDMSKALMLLYLDGNDHPSIADVLGISVSNVGTKLARIKKRLRTSIEERSCSHSKELPDATR